MTDATTVQEDKCDFAKGGMNKSHLRTQSSPACVTAAGTALLFTILLAIAGKARHVSTPELAPPRAGVNNGIIHNAQQQQPPLQFISRQVALPLPRERKKLPTPVSTVSWAGQYKGRIRNVDGADGPVAAFIGPAVGGSISGHSNNGGENEVHASTLAVLHRGTLFCAFFQGSEGKGVTSIMLTHLPRQARAWSVPQPVIDGAHPIFQATIQAPPHSRTRFSTFVSLQNPVLFADPVAYMVNGVEITRLHLYFTAQIVDAGQGTSQVWHSVAEVNESHLKALPHVAHVAHAFSQPVLMMKSSGSFVRNPPILVNPESKTSNATYALPVYYTPLGLKDKASQFSALRLAQSPGLHFDESCTEVRLTHPGDYLAQPALSAIKVKSKESPILLAAFRDRQGEALYMSTFTPSPSGVIAERAAHRTILPNNNKAIALLALASGSCLLLFNNCRAPLKAPLTAAVSHDGGETWQAVRDLQPRFSDNEFSYPAAVQSLDDGNIHITYTWSGSSGKRRRAAIRYLRLPSEEWAYGRWPGSAGATRGLYHGVKGGGDRNITVNSILKL